MNSLRMTNKADLKVYYEADSSMYDLAWISRHGVTEERFIARYSDCSSIGFQCGDMPFGGVILDGKDVHIAVLPAFHGKWGALLRPALTWLFSQQSEVRGKVPRLNYKGQRFLRRLGGKLIDSDENFMIFRLSFAEVPSALRPSLQ